VNGATTFVLILVVGRINRRLTLGMQNGPMPDSPRWLNRMRAILGAPTARFALAEALASRDAHAAAFPLFVQAAQAGLPQAQYRLGRSYLLGLGVPPSIGEALRWLRRAAEAGETAAQTQLAALVLQGVSDKGAPGLFDDGCQEADFAGRDYEGAERWCRQAVAAGSAEAKALLGFILTAGPEDRRNPVLGEALYREAAQAGWSRGQLGLAMTLLRDGTPKSAAESVKLLQSAAADGVSVAHHLLGMLAESGAAGSVDFTAAAASYKAAAELGHTQAQVRYGFALLLGRGTERNVFTAETWLRRAALSGDAQAAAVIGYLYARDGDLPPNHAEAAIWLRRAAEAGHAGAARTLGRMLLLGTGTPKDIPEAVRWLRIAGDNGDQTARTDLLRLALTRQVGEDDQLAVTGWLRESAAAGDAAAQFDLGLCLAQGIGAERDDQAAFGWVRRASEGGHPEATRMLAQLAGPA
jgi:TPR repeat protein